MLNAGADLNARTEYGGDTPLHWATKFNNNPAVITALLDAGADLAVQDEEGKVPWDYAKENAALKDSDV